MDQKALYKISYGVFMLATKYEDKVNGCITNTCMQVASDPTRIAISCINTNYTRELLDKSGLFTLSLLDDSCAFQTIKHFGMQSGRNVDKFEGITLPTDVNGIPYLNWQTCAVISGRVVDKKDLGSHSLYIAELDDAMVLSDRPPLTYADYQNRLKPRPAQPKAERPIKAWRCTICGYVYEGAVLPADFICPRCGHPSSDFEPVFE